MVADIRVGCYAYPVDDVVARSIYPFVNFLFYSLAVGIYDAKMSISQGYVY